MDKLFVKNFQGEQFLYAEISTNMHDLELKMTKHSNLKYWIIEEPSGFFHVYILYGQCMFTSEKVSQLFTAPIST